ncbi:hypothetical protein HanRHA438_Chr11g0500271 [Helianthus annuus]|nr:hypothetical protein HanRHA438_Chr11g0500271 [Helianthus annuus]
MDTKLISFLRQRRMNCLIYVVKKVCNIGEFIPILQQRYHLYMGKVNTVLLRA